MMKHPGSSGGIYPPEEKVKLGKEDVEASTAPVNNKE